MLTATTFRNLVLFLFTAALLSHPATAQWQARLVDQQVIDAISVDNGRPQLSPSGRYLVYYRGESKQLVSQHIDSGQVAVLHTGDLPLDGFQFVPDRDEIVSLRLDSLQWSALDGSFRRTIYGSSSDIGTVLFNNTLQHGPWKESNYLVSSSDEVLFFHRYNLISITLGDPVTSRTLLNNYHDDTLFQTEGMVLSPNGRWLLIGGEHGDYLHLYDRQKESFRCLTPPGMSGLFGYGFSPDSSMALCQGELEDGDSRLFICDVEGTGTLRPLPVQKHASAEWYTTDGQYLLCRDITAEGAVHYLLALDGSDARLPVALPESDASAYTITELQGHPSRMLVTIFSDSAPQRFFSCRFDGSNPIEFDIAHPSRTVPDLSKYGNLHLSAYLPLTRQFARILEFPQSDPPQLRLFLFDIDSGMVRELDADVGSQWGSRLFSVDGDAQYVYLFKNRRSSINDYHTLARVSRVPLDGGPEEIIHDFPSNLKSSRYITIFTKQDYSALAQPLHDGSLLIFNDMNQRIPTSYPPMDLYALTPPNAAAPDWLQTGSQPERFE